MADTETTVTMQPESVTEPEAREPVTPEPAAVQDQEERIPHSRVEEMYKRRLEKAQAEWRNQHLSPLEKKMAQYEEVLGKVGKGQLAFLKEMGLYKDEPPKPFTREDFQSALDERFNKHNEELRQYLYQERIVREWGPVANKYPKFAGNKMFQDAALYAFSQNPQKTLGEHADEIVKTLLDPYADEKASALAKKKVDELRPSNRVVPGGRGAGGGAGGSAAEPKQSVAQKIAARLKAAREG